MRSFEAATRVDAPPDVVWEILTDVGDRRDWEAGLPLRLAAIERTYHLDAQDGGGTMLTVRQDHTGPLAFLLDRTTPDLNPSFRQFCAGLKAVAERRVTHPSYRTATGVTGSDGGDGSMERP